MDVRAVYLFRCYIVAFRARHSGLNQSSFINLFVLTHITLFRKLQTFCVAEIEVGICFSHLPIITPGKIEGAQIEEKQVQSHSSPDCCLTYLSMYPSGSSAEASIVMITYWVSVLDLTSYPASYLVSFALFPYL